MHQWVVIEITRLGEVITVWGPFPDDGQAWSYAMRIKESPLSSEDVIVQPMTTPVD